MAKDIRGSIVYQVYPRSFQDSNGDGIGDINGIIERLDYLDELGVDYVWINPLYQSPMKDYGYDVSDYCAVDPQFGTLDDIERLISLAHQKEIGIILDLVPNHTSDQHEWFIESCKGAAGSKMDWYIWKDAKPDGSAPNNWIARFGGSAWEWHSGRNQYYLHSFLKEQPDLNWESPQVRQAFADVMRFWLSKGIDGFRLDAINLLGKDYRFLDEPLSPRYNPETDIEYEQLDHIYSRDVGNFYSHLSYIAQVAAEYGDKLLMFESWFYERANPALYHSFYTNMGRRNCLPFNFELMLMDWDARQLQLFLDNFQGGLRPDDIPAYMLGNHDLARFLSRIGLSDARLGATLLLTLPGVSLIYYGDEIGMANTQLSPDVQTDPDGRDPYRTPMQWSDETNAGFTSGLPWLPVANDYTKINVAAESRDSNSMLALYKLLVRLRHEYACLREGTYSPGPIMRNGISFYRRYDETSTCLVLLNLGEDEEQVALDEQWGESILITNDLFKQEAGDIARSFTLPGKTAVILINNFRGVTTHTAYTAD